MVKGSIRYDPDMDRTFLLIAAVAGFLGVSLGAFGAHGLRDRLSPDMMAAFQTGVQYHLIHAAALLAVSAIAVRTTSRMIPMAGWLFTLGILLFSGSLYVLAISGVTRLGMVTPFGGLAFLAGWALLAIAAL
jgi:uncharacterized membrane protein YgdD (TMEM256/DUF423 family)